jgi:flagellar hook-associated protein 2
MTFTLQQATPALTTLTLGIKADTSIVQNAITAFADAYNAFKLFASTQQLREADGTPKEDSVLANDSTLRNVISLINTEVNNIVAGITTGDPDKLADIGISFEDFVGDADNPETKNIMVVDTDALTSALQADFDGVRGVFEYQLTTDDENLSTFARTNALGINDFVLSIDRNTGIYQASYTDPDTGDPATVNLDATVLSTGVTLTGPSGSVLEGLELIYISGATTIATVNVSITQGIGDRLFNVLETMLDDEEGTLTGAEDALSTLQSFNEEEIARIDDQVATYRDQLVEKYAQLEAALTKANQLLQLLTAQSNAQLAASGG